jgi:hypothetical protein
LIFGVVDGGDISETDRTMSLIFPHATENVQHERFKCIDQGDIPNACALNRLMESAAQYCPS